MQGEEPPYPPVTLDFKKDFQAVGDGVTDDTAAFARALNGTPAGDARANDGLRLHIRSQCMGYSLLLPDSGHP